MLAEVSCGFHTEKLVGGPKVRGEPQISQCVTAIGRHSCSPLRCSSGPGVVKKAPHWETGSCSPSAVASSQLYHAERFFALYKKSARPPSTLQWVEGRNICRSETFRGVLMLVGLFLIINKTKPVWVSVHRLEK